MFTYEPKTVKMEAKTESQHPVLELDRGQFLTEGNWIQRQRQRECIVRRYLSEQQMDASLRHIRRTQDTPPVEVTDQQVEEIKEMLLKRDGIRVRDALDVVNKRKIQRERPTV